MIYSPNNDTGKRAWCGPTAISCITQVSISKIYKMIRRIRGPQFRYVERKRGWGYIKKRVKGAIMSMYDDETLLVLERLGFTPKACPKYGKLSLRQFCEDSAHTGPFLISTHNHYLVVSHGAICDTLTKGGVVAWTDYPKLRCMVTKVWRF